MRAEGSDARKFVRARHNRGRKELRQRPRGELPPSDTSSMSNEPKTEDNPPHREKQVMDEPQEEFVADQSVPSRDISDVRDLPKKEDQTEK